MTDEFATPEAGEETPAAPAAPPAPSAEEIEQRLSAQFEDRFKGLQRVIAQKDEAIRQAQEQLLETRMSGMSEEEKAELERKQWESQFNALKAENELLKLSQEFPEEVPLYQQFLEATELKQQLALLREIRKAQAAAAAAPAPAESSEEGEPPDVDLNNPPAGDRFESGAVMIDGQPMTEQMADRILNSIRAPLSR